MVHVRLTETLLQLQVAGIYWLDKCTNDGRICWVVVVSQMVPMAQCPRPGGQHGPARGSTIHPESGHILIDGMDIKYATLASVRAQVGLKDVDQLFADTWRLLSTQRGRSLSDDQRLHLEALRLRLTELSQQRPALIRQAASALVAKWR